MIMPPGTCACLCIDSHGPAFTILCCTFLALFFPSANPSPLSPLHQHHLHTQAKAYTTRVGSGPYPTEIFGELAEQVR